MNKISYFFKSLLPYLAVVIIGLAVSIPTTAVFAVKELITGDSAMSIIDLVTSLSNDSTVIQYSNFIYGVIGILVFGIWYRKIFVKPFRHKIRPIPGGFSFHTIMALLCMAVGLQLTTNLVADIALSLQPKWAVTYDTMMDTIGYNDMTMILIVYSGFLAPIVEELVFRGLIFRYCRYALLFWLTNIWQALLFGLLHGNMLQDIYAFFIGLFLGWVAHRGRGIKYSIVLHILFNLAGLYYSGAFSIMLNLNYVISIGIGIVLLIFGVYLFYTDFIPAEEPGAYTSGDYEQQHISSGTIDPEDDDFYDSIM